MMTRKEVAYLAGQAGSIRCMWVQVRDLAWRHDGG